MLSTFLIACLESCRVALARAGTSLPQSVMIATLELGRHAVRFLRRV
ncbi:MAG: hypothetical protein LAO77_17985 [Acidobacteriia bacterium]|nr:hypothetical protein [Terriglobia bacterium]